MALRLGPIGDIVLSAVVASDAGEVALLLHLDLELTTGA